jgi:head-tail adaptor
MVGEIAGRLKQRIRFERRTSGHGGVAEGAEAWEPVAECWAELRPVESASPSQVSADTRITLRRWRILMRAGAEVSLGMRALWRGLDLRVLGVESDPMTPDRVMVVAEELGP